MEALDGALTALFGSQRSGIDIAIVLFALTVAFIAVRRSDQIVQIFVGWVAARVRVMEERNRACVLLANALSEIQDGIAATRGEVKANQTQLYALVDQRGAEDGARPDDQ